MPEGVPTIEVNDAWRVRRDALWQCRMCATTSLVCNQIGGIYIYTYSPRYNSRYFILMWTVTESSTVCYSLQLTTTHLIFAMHTRTHAHTRAVPVLLQLPPFATRLQLKRRRFRQQFAAPPVLLFCGWRSDLWRRNNVREQDAVYLDAPRQCHGHLRCWVAASLFTHGKLNVE